jgi:hypothetical protein
MNAKKRTPRLLTPTDVRQAATSLILTEGSTTTLIVSQFLRNQGYGLYNAELVSWLTNVAQEEGWTVTDNGMFRVYSCPSHHSLSC